MDGYKQFNQILHNVDNINELSTPNIKANDYKLINPSEWVLK